MIVRLAVDPGSPRVIFRWSARGLQFPGETSLRETSVPLEVLTADGFLSTEDHDKITRDLVDRIQAYSLAIEHLAMALDGRSEMAERPSPSEADALVRRVAELMSALRHFKATGSDLYPHSAVDIVDAAYEDGWRP